MNDRLGRPIHAGDVIAYAKRSDNSVEIDVYEVRALADTQERGARREIGMLCRRIEPPGKRDVWLKHPDRAVVVRWAPAD